MNSLYLIWRAFFSMTPVLSKLLIRTDGGTDQSESDGTQRQKEFIPYYMTWMH